MATKLKARQSSEQAAGPKGDRQLLDQLALDFDRIHGLISGRLFSYIAREMQNGDISYSQQNALFILFVNGPLSVGQLATELQLSQTATSHLIDRLLIRKLISRVVHPDDRRRKIIALTPAGRERILDMKRFTVASYLSVLESLPEPVIASLADSLRQMADHLPAPLLPDVEP